MLMEETFRPMIFEGTYLLDVLEQFEWQRDASGADQRITINAQETDANESWRDVAFHGPARRVSPRSDRFRYTNAIRERVAPRTRNVVLIGAGGERAE